MSSCPDRPERPGWPTKAMIALIKFGLCLRPMLLRLRQAAFQVQLESVLAFEPYGTGLGWQLKLSIIVNSQFRQITKNIAKSKQKYLL